MNDDLISREDVKNAFHCWKTVYDYCHSTDCNDIPFSEAFDLIDSAPAISPYKAIHDELHKGEEE